MDVGLLISSRCDFNWIYEGIRCILEVYKIDVSEKCSTKLFRTVSETLSYSISGNLNAADILRVFV